MFPGIDGFRWDAGHIIFLGAFFSLAAIIVSTVIAAYLRTLRDEVPEREQAIRWHVDFSELSPADRRCRHELNGEIHRRQCPNEFDCRGCETHPTFLKAEPGPMA